MSIYYKYQFTSPEGIYSTVKEELKSYFDSGAVDDLLFPVYLNKCLSKLGKTTLVIAETPLIIKNYQARLPDNYQGVKEAWATMDIPLTSYTSANSLYTQGTSINTVQITPVITSCSPITAPTVDCNGNQIQPTPCIPVHMQKVFKSNLTTERSYRKTYLLSPGNISAQSQCGNQYTGELSQYGQLGEANRDFNFTPDSATINSFDIRDNKFVTTFREGIVHLVFYSSDYDGEGNQMIPDNFRFKEYIEAFLKFKVFETLTNQTNDETFNQMQQKLQYYKAAADEAFIMADIESKKQDSWTKQRRIQKTINRHQMYELPLGSGGRRRY